MDDSGPDDDGFSKADLMLHSVILQSTFSLVTAASKTCPLLPSSVAVAPIKPVLRKHGKLISLFRSFILSRPSRRSLKQQGILRERVFGCDLGEHLLNAGHDGEYRYNPCVCVCG